MSARRLEWEPVNPTGTLLLARRVLGEDDHDAKIAARELCRECEGWTLTAVVAAFFEGKLSTVIFDRIADAHDFVRAEFEADKAEGIAAWTFRRFGGHN